MNKHEKFYNRIEGFKQRFQKLPSETIRDRLRFGFLVKEAAIAYREVLEERGEPNFDYENNPQSGSSKPKDLS